MLEQRVLREAYVWRDGWPEWKTAAQAFPDYFDQSIAIADSTNSYTPLSTRVDGEAIALQAEGASVPPSFDKSPSITLAANVSTEHIPLAAIVEPTSLAAGTDSIGTSVNEQQRLGTTRSNPVVARRRKRKDLYLVVITALAFVALVLIAILITVLSQ